MNDYERKLIQANDDQSMRSRVFVGNLNTLLVSRDELQHRFSKYGPVRAVGIFKGYAFIQYDDEATARLASTCEDQQVIVGQKVDCNLANEPKPNQRAGGTRKPKTSSSFSGKTKTTRYPSSHSAAAYSGAAGYGYPMMPYPGYYDPMAYGYAAPPPAPRGRSSSGSALYTSYPSEGGRKGSPKKPGVPPSKRARADDDADDADDADVTQNGQGEAEDLKASKSEDAEVQKLRRAAEQRRLEILAEELRSAEAKTSNVEDVLLCSSCRRVFGSLLNFVEHKRVGCSLRQCATCNRDDAELRSLPLACASPGCDAQCESAWALLSHYETVHSTTLHKLVTPSKEQAPKAASTSQSEPAAAGDGAQSQQAPEVAQEQPEEAQKAANANFSDDVAMPETA